MQLNTLKAWGEYMTLIIKNANPTNLNKTAKAIDQYNTLTGTKKERITVEWKSEIDTLKDRLDRKSNEIEMLKEALDIKEQLNEELRKSDDKQKKVIKAMTTWISSNSLLGILVRDICKNQKICISKNQSGDCETCIINYFESEVKE